MNSDLNIKQLKFIDNLFNGMSQKRAYIEAGYKDDESNASRMTSNDKVKEEIERRLAAFISCSFVACI